MIRIFVLQRVLAVIQRITAISDLLKPATWQKIAIVHGLVGLSFILVYGFLDRRIQETDIPALAIAELLPAQVPVPQQPALSLSNPEIVAKPELNLAAVGQFLRRYSRRSSNVGYVIVVTDAYFIPTAGASTSPHTSYVRHEMGLRSIGDFGSGGWNLPSITAPERPVLVQPGLGSGQSLLETILKLLALFQGITTMINGSLASILGLIAYRRNKVDMVAKQLEVEVKRLQILQMQAALDKQARERLKEAQEAARSSIVIIS